MANSNLIWTDDDDGNRIQCKVESRPAVITAYANWHEDTFNQAIAVVDDMGPAPAPDDDDDDDDARPAQRRRLSLENFGD